MNNEITPDIMQELADRLRSLRDEAFTQYSRLVEQVLNDRITDKCELERIMDGLLDFCDEERFIEIYRKLCRHIYYKHPQLVGEHVALFRAQFETAEEESV